MLGKHFTKLVAFSLSISLLFVCIPTAFAAEPNYEVTPGYTIETYYENDVLVTEETWILTPEEAIQELAVRKGWTLQESSAYILSCNTINPLSNTSTYTTKKTKTYTYGFCEVEIGGLFQFTTDGMYTQVDKCLDYWTAATGSGPYTWDEISVVDVNQDKYPWIQIHLMGRGNIEVEIDTSVSPELTAQFVTLGFNISVEIGTVVYLRKTVDLELMQNLFTA